MNVVLLLQLSQKESSVARISHTCTCMSLLPFSWTIHVLLPKPNTSEVPEDLTEMCTYVEITYQVEVEDMRLCKSISYIKLYMTDLYH